MDVFNVTLRHGGRLDHSIRKTRVTTPEIAVMRQLHGTDAVVEITRVGKVNRGSDREMDRLRRLYQPRLQEGEHPVDILWPGQQKEKLPLYLKQIGIGEDSPFMGKPGKSLPAEDQVNLFKDDDDEFEPFSDDELAESEDDNEEVEGEKIVVSETKEPVPPPNPIQTPAPPPAPAAAAKAKAPPAAGA